mmetsp:Transcript_86033/g.251739  ORF Transcript_86033/g.251739 Transcript_86033/m.251739 type:complete len:223 (+) Transcript_86033:505-1173(+)
MVSAAAASWAHREQGRRHRRRGSLETGLQQAAHEGKRRPGVGARCGQPWATARAPGQLADGQAAGGNLLAARRCEGPLHLQPRGYAGPHLRLLAHGALRGGCLRARGRRAALFPGPPGRGPPPRGPRDDAALCAGRAGPAAGRRGHPAPAPPAPRRPRRAPRAPRGPARAHGGAPAAQPRGRLRREPLPEPAGGGRRLRQRRLALRMADYWALHGCCLPCAS